MKNLSILLFFTCLICSGQDFSGIILDNSTKKSIPYANIYLKNTPVGVISNADGAYTIFIDQLYKENNLTISVIGYKTYTIPIAKLKLNSTIYLSRQALELNEVSVVSSNKSITGNDIIKKALDKYDINFPTEPSLSKGFIRYTQRTPKEYKWLIEGTFDYYEPGYLASTEKLKIDIYQLRQSLDNRRLDTSFIYYNYLSKKKNMPSKKVFEKSQNWKDASAEEIQEAIRYNDRSPYKSLSSVFKKSTYNPLRHFKIKDSPFANNLFFDKHTFTKDSIIPMGESWVYKIKITPNRKNRKIFKNFGKSLLPIGFIYVNVDDFSILEINYSLIYHRKKGKVHRRLEGSNYKSRTSIKFKKMENNKMYPFYIKYETPATFSQNLSDVVLISSGKKEGDLTDAYYFKRYEILFSEILISQSQFDDEISSSKWDDDLFTTRPYNADFWDSFNVLLETEDELNMRKDLEKKVSLKNQFN